MAKSKRRRRNGKVIKVKVTTQRVLNKEAHKMINDGQASLLYDSRGKIKPQYINVITVGGKHVSHK